MIAYVDASALVKRYIEEDGSAEVEALLGRAVPCSSRLTELEIASAMARRCREGDLCTTKRDSILSRLHQDLGSFYIVELADEVVVAAVDVLGRRPLRAADAVHVGSCLVLQRRLKSQIVLVAFDRRLSEAARAEGLATT